MSKVNVSKLFGGVFLIRHLHRKYGFLFQMLSNQTSLLLGPFFNFSGFFFGPPLCVIFDGVLNLNVNIFDLHSNI